MMKGVWRHLEAFESLERISVGWDLTSRRTQDVFRTKARGVFVRRDGNAVEYISNTIAAAAVIWGGFGVSTMRGYGKVVFKES